MRIHARLPVSPSRFATPSGPGERTRPRERRERRSTRAQFLISALSLWVAASACGEDSDSSAPVGPDASAPEAGSPLFKATVRRTSFGIPHIQADDFAGLGYGTGYAFAEDNLCILAEELVTSRGERAKYFGDGGYDLGQTTAKSNVSSDAVYRLLITPERIAAVQNAQPPEVNDAGRGFAAGVSRYVREIRSGAHAGRHERCRNEPWLREVTLDDLYRRVIKLGLLASSAGFINGIAAAKPLAMRIGPPLPPESGAPSPERIHEGLERMAPGFVSMRRGVFGSNMYAFGRELTGGGGIQFGNPHFPWYGGERLYQMHLTIPGKINVQGATLYGLPFVLIGFNDSFAWSHTVSTAYRFTLYALTTKETDPFTYLKDGVEKKIQPVTFDIEVKDGDNMRSEKVELYVSEYGPMIDLGNPAFAWANQRAFTLRDANLDNTRLVRHFYRWNTAKTFDEFKRIHAEEVALPWVNTTAADKDGNVYYADITVVPNVPDRLATECAVPGYSAALSASAPGLALMTARASCDWLVDPAAPQPGIFAGASLPKVERTDWVVNCNDSYWLTHPKSPLEGFSAIVGREKYAQSLRSRLCHEHVLDRIAGTDGISGAGFSTETVRRMVLGARVYSAEKSLDAVRAAFCTGAPIVLTRDPANGKDIVPPVTVDTSAPCAALASWDRTTNTGSKGSIVWDEFWPRVEAVGRSATLYKVPFDPNDPVGTPRDLDTQVPELAQAFAAAIEAVKGSGFAFDVVRSDISWREGTGSSRIPVPGGQQRTGNFAIAQTKDYVLKPGVGYGPVNYGNSYMQVVGLSSKGVEAYTFVTYGQSTDPASPHFDDYTRAYSEKRWHKAAFTEEEIAADTESTTQLEE